MEPVDMEISSATEEEDDDDDDEFNKLLNSLSGMEECLVPLHDESNDGAVIEPGKENKAYNNIAEGNQTETLEKTEEGSKQHNCIEISDVNLITVSPISSNASTLSRESTPRRNCQTDCDNEAQRPTPEVSTAQLSDNDVILDSINKCHKNLETGSGSDHSDICFFGTGTVKNDGSIEKSKQTSTLPDNYELNSKCIDSAIFDGAVTCSPKNATTEHHVTSLVQTQSQESENATPPKLNDSDSDCLIVEHIAASDHRLNGLIDLTKAENEDVALPLENRSEESLLKEISQIRKALMKHSTKTHKKNKKHKHQKSHSSSKKKKKRSKSRTKSPSLGEVSEEFKSWTKSPSLEKVSDDEDEIPDEPRLIMVTESGKLSVNITNLRSKQDSGKSDDSSTTKSKDEETAVTAKPSKSTENESIDSTATATPTEIQNVDSSATQFTEIENVDTSAATQSIEIQTADSTETTKLKQKVNLVSNCNEISTNEENATEVNKAKMLELPKLGKPADKADSDGSPLWNSDGEISTDSSEKSNITRTDNSNLTRSDFDDNSRVTVLTFGTNKNSPSFDSNPLRRKLSYNPDQNDIAIKPRQKAVYCESGKELKSKFRRTGTPKSYQGRGSKKESFAPPGDIGSCLSRKLDGSDSEPERPQQSAPSADRFNRFMSDSDSEKSINSAISRKSKSIGHYDDVNWKTSTVHSVPELNYCRGRSRSILKSPPSYSFQRSRRSPSPLPNLYRSLSRSPNRYRSCNISSYRSPSLTYRSMSRRRSRTPSITRELYYRASLSRLRSPNERPFRSKSREVRSPSHPRFQRSPSRHRRKSHAYRSPSMFSRSPSYTRWSKSRAYRSPPRSRRSKSRTYRSPSRSHRSKSRTYRSRSRSGRSKSRRRRSKSRRNSPASRSNSTRSPSIIRATRACSPLEDMRQQLKKNNEAAVQQALGGLEKPQLQPVQMQNPGYMSMPYSMMHNPGMMNQMGMMQISHVFSQAAGPSERSLGPPDRPLGPPDRPLEPPDAPLGPPDRQLGSSNRALGPPDRPIGSSNRALGSPDRPLGLSNRTLGPLERPFGPPEGPPGPPGRLLASPECYMPLHFYLHPPYL